MQTLLYVRKSESSNNIKTVSIKFLKLCINKRQYGNYAHHFIFFSLIKILVTMVTEKAKIMAVTDGSFDNAKSIPARLMKINM